MHWNIYVGIDRVSDYTVENTKENDQIRIKSTSDDTVKQITQVSDYTGVVLDRFYCIY